MNKNKNRDMRKSFTFLELMLAIVIIGILSATAATRLSGRAERARVAAAKADIESNIPLAIDLYEMDLGEYPSRIEDLVSKSSASENWNGPYLKKMPKDPWSREYNYKTPGEHNSDYDLSSSGKDGVFGNEDDINNWQ